MPDEIPDYLGPHASLPRKPLPEDIDLYCLECGYNLRGLSGDPRRCPECGHWNPVGDLEIPAEFIAAQLRRMETAPAACVAMALLAAVFLFPVGLVVVETSRHGPQLGAILCCGLPLVVSIVVWILAASVFRTSCMGNPNWVAALRLYHTYGLLLCIVIAGLILAGTGNALSVRSGGPARFGTITDAIVGLAAIAAAVAVLVVLGQRAHRRLRAIIEPMQRDVAVKIARQRLRARMGRAPRTGWFNL